MLTIQTNVSVLDSVNNLRTSKTDLAKSVNSIASGKRINEASDDGAGLSVATRLEADQTSLSQAARNTNDALGLVHTVEGTLDTLTNIAIRFRELSVQSLNDTYTTADRQLMLTEMEDLYVDWRRVSAEAEYNDIALTSSNSTLSFQVSKDGGAADAITVNLSDFQVSTITAFTTVGTTATNGTAVDSTTAAANLRLIDRSISQLGQMKAKAGSMQNRLENAIGQNTAENNSLYAAQGRIIDVNYASETVNMTRLQMQRQTSIASISQARNLPLGLLALID